MSPALRFLGLAVVGWVALFWAVGLARLLRDEY